MITLSDGVTDLDLPEALLWVDEAWTPIVQTTEHTITGALVIEEGTRQAGRPITLQSPEPDTGLVSWETLQQLQAWSEIAGKTFTLTLAAADSYNVQFRHRDGALTYTAYGEMTQRQTGTVWHITIRLMET